MITCQSTNKRGVPALLAVACLTFFSQSTQVAKSADSVWKLTFTASANGYRRSAPQSSTISRDGKLLAIGCRDRSIRIWDLEKGVELRRLIGHANIPKSMSFSPDNLRLLSTSVDGYPQAPLRVWSVSTGELLYEHQIRTESASAVQYHPSQGTFLASMNVKNPVGSWARYTLDLFDSQTFKRLSSTNTGNAYRSDLGFSNDGRNLLLGQIGEYIPAEIVDLSNQQARKLPKQLQRCVFSPDGRYIAGLDKSPAAVILDSRTLQEVRRFPMPRNSNSRPVASRFNNVVFDLDSRTVFTTASRNWNRWDLATGEIKRSGRLFSSYARLCLGGDGIRMVETSSNGPTIIWGVKTGQPIAKLHCLDEIDQWAIETSQNYFQHSNQVSTTFPTSIATSERMAYVEKHRSSVLVQRLLRGMSVEDAEALPENGAPPSVAIKLLTIEQETAKVRITAQSATPEISIRDVSVRVDGRELSTFLTKSLTVSAPQPHPEASVMRQFETTVQFPPGRNEATIQAVAIDSFGQTSPPATVAIQRPQKVAPIPGRLFVLSVGVSEYDNPDFNLLFSRADAKALAKVFLNQKGRAFGDVQVQVYTDKNATVTNIKNGLDWLKRSCTPSDVAVVLFSGHGITREKGLYYVTHEANMNGVQFTCLNWETLAASLHDTQAKQILFFADACYAGAFGESDLAPQKELADRLRDSAGVMVFTSSRGNEVSFEKPELGHGAFVAAILEGLAGQADLNEDGSITVEELSELVSHRVAELTDNEQHPHLSDLGRFNPKLIIAKPH